MNLSPEMWDLLKLIFGAYLVYVLNKSDRNTRELFKRLRNLELICAGNHGLSAKELKLDEDP